MTEKPIVKIDPFEDCVEVELEFTQDDIYKIEIDMDGNLKLSLFLTEDKYKTFKKQLT